MYRGIFRTRGGKLVERVVFAKFDHWGIDALQSATTTEDRLEGAELLYAWKGQRCVFNG